MGVYDPPKGSLRKVRRLEGRDYVALVLAMALALSLIALAIGGLLDVLDRPSERAAQLLGLLYGGIIAVLSAYITDKRGPNNGS